MYNDKKNIEIKNNSSVSRDVSFQFSDCVIASVYFIHFK